MLEKMLDKADEEKKKNDPLMKKNYDEPLFGDKKWLIIVVLFFDRNLSRLGYILVVNNVILTTVVLHKLVV